MEIRLREVAEEFPEFRDDHEELPRNEREILADRALRGAVIGLMLFPVQLYVVWLLIHVMSMKGALRPRQRRNAIVAAAISFTYLLVLRYFLKGMTSMP